jgi:hypothetical protein
MPSLRLSASPEKNRGPAFIVALLLQLQVRDLSHQL